MEKEIINKLHTTKLGEERIKRNLYLGDIDTVDYCKKIICDSKCSITSKGKNWYCQKDNILITVNRSSYTIITAKLIKEK